MEEKRRARRLTLQRECVIIWDNNSHQARIVDISAVGCAVRSLARPPMGAEVTVRHGSMGDLKAKVMRYFEDGFGVQFDLSREAIGFVLRAVTLDLE